MKLKKQVLVLPGGSVFKKYSDYLNYLKNYKIGSLKDLNYKDWKSNLEKDLGKNFQVIYLKMPSRKNSKYIEWKIWFEKFLPFLKNNLILIGHSLGAAFLVKYIAENGFPVKISQLHLVALPSSNKREYLGSFKLPRNFQKIEKNIDMIFLYQSKDDPIVPYSDFLRISKKFKKAKKIIFKNKGHFRQSHFPKLISFIKKSKS